ncbi:MAG: ABC transporter permease [Acidipropionibacterium sp.]|jgi:hypothetical protein|nr:ABC transporter permease [Acidipropionibacterium sp.]
MGALLAPWLLDGLKAVGFFGPGVAVRVGFQPMSLLAVVVSMVLVAALAGRSASRQITRQGLTGVSSETVARMSWWSVAGRAVVGVGGVIVIALLDPQTVGNYGMLALPFLAVVPAVALAPLLVPAGAWVIGRLVGWFAPGPGLLAARRSSKDRVRFARLATPVLVAVGTLGGFMVANVPDEQVQAASFTGYVQAQTVLTTVGAADADRVVEAVSGGPLARVASVNRVNGSAISSLTFSDAADMGAVTSQKTTSGDVAKVGGGNVAVSTGEGVVGDTITVPDVNGRPVVLRVVATVNDPLYDGGIFLGWDQIDRFAREPGKLDVTIYAKGVTASAAQREVRTAGVEAQVYDRDAYVGRLIDNRKAGSMSGNVGIFGTVYLMCLVSVVQMAVSGGMSRRREFGILRSLGVGAHGIVRTVATECVIIHVIAGVLIGISVGALAQEFATANGTSTLSAIRQVVPLTAAAFIVVTLLALLAHTASTRITVDRIIRGAN